jgi:hypothetical protein
VIIYDEFELAASANAMLARAADGMDERVEWSVKPWRVDLLSASPAAGAALAEAADAHLIVLAVRQDQSLSARLRDWLEQWATRRQDQDAALAVFGGGNGDAFPAPIITELSQFAKRHGLSFIFDDGSPAEDASAVFARSQRQGEVVQPPTLRHILEEPVYSHYEHWGINE